MFNDYELIDEEKRKVKDCDRIQAGRSWLLVVAKRQGVVLNSVMSLWSCDSEQFGLRCGRLLCFVRRILFSDVLTVISTSLRTIV